MKFTLICEHDDNNKVTHEFKNVLLADTLDNIQNFLKGCGFVFDGILDIVEEEVSKIEIDTRPISQENYRNSDDVDIDGRC